MGRLFILSMIFLSAVNTHHSRQMKKRKKITKEITGQMARKYDWTESHG